MFQYNPSDGGWVELATKLPKGTRGFVATLVDSSVFPSSCGMCIRELLAIGEISKL